MLQGKSMDTNGAYSNIELLKTQLKTLRRDCDHVFTEDVWAKARALANIAEIDLTAPRRCGKKTKKNTIPSQIQKNITN